MGNRHCLCGLIFGGWTTGPGPKKRGGAGEGVREGKGGEGEGREKRADGGTAVKGRVGVVSSFGVGSLPTGRNA